MKKSFLVLVVMCLVASFTYVRAENGLQGPKAKNHKVWQTKDASNSIDTPSKERVTGPKAKNANTLNRKNSAENYEFVMIIATEKMVGPKAKNKRHQR